MRSKAYSFKCDEKNTTKLKRISKSCSKYKKYRQYKKCLDGEEYQKGCDNWSLKSINHEMYLQKIKKSSLSFFDNKRIYLN